jgi:hypothetical protein
VRYATVRFPEGAHVCLYGGTFPGMLGYKLHGNEAALITRGRTWRIGSGDAEEKWHSK